ncbi:MAG: hypothetical protein ACI35O_04050 [Bacillaceae bacterium]
MRKIEPKESKVDLVMVIFVVAYSLFCIWWQYYYVYPPIREGDYSQAFNRAMDWNPLTPFVGLLVFHLVAKILGWISDFWVLLFGRR